MSAMQMIRETRRVAADELVLKRDDRLSNSRVALAGTAAEGDGLQIQNGNSRHFISIAISKT